jgi:ATP-binding cassette subfamily C protein CydD
VALVGESGAGKSTATRVLLGLRSADAGRVTVKHAGRTLDLADLDLDTWWAQTTWVPQHPVVVPATLAENARLTSPEADDDALAAAARLTGLDAVVAAAPLGWATPVGLGGLGLSAGERQRLALTRALLRDTPLVVLDEPSAHLDAASEQVVLDVVRRWRAQGRTVLVVAHRASLTALADDVVVVAASTRACAA